MDHICSTLELYALSDSHGVAGVIAVAGVLSLSAQCCHIVVGGVHLGMGHAVVLLVEMSLVFLKLKERKKKKLTSGTRRWQLPVPLVVTLLVPHVSTFVAVSILILTWGWQLFLLFWYLMNPSHHCSSCSHSVHIVCLEILIGRVKESWKIKKAYLRGSGGNPPESLHMHLHPVASVVACEPLCVG